MSTEISIDRALAANDFDVLEAWWCYAADPRTWNDTGNDRTRAKLMRGGFHPGPGSGIWANLSDRGKLMYEAICESEADRDYE